MYGTTGRAQLRGCTFYGVAAAARDDLEVGRHEVAHLVSSELVS